MSGLIVPLILLSSISVPSNGFTINRIPTSSRKVSLVQGRNRLSPLYGWGPDPIWSSAKISSITPASSNSVSVQMEVSDELASTFLVPGQYVQVKPDEETKPLFLAIASPPDPDESSFEFLVKKTKDNAWITSETSSILSEGCFTSQVLGKGFPVEENVDSLKYDFPTQNIMLFATGSGIAPLRSVIESEESETGGILGLKKGRTARLYYGCKNLEEMAYKGRFEAWEQMGVQVVPVLSREVWYVLLLNDFLQIVISSTQFYFIHMHVYFYRDGRMGYVQTALEEDGVQTPRNSAALMCGVKGMCESVKDVLMKSGTFEGRIMTNF